MLINQYVKIQTSNQIYSFQNFLPYEMVEYQNQEWVFYPFSITEDKDNDAFDSDTRTITTTRDFWNRESMETAYKRATVEVITDYPESGNYESWIGQIVTVKHSGAIVSFDVGHPLTAVENELPNKLVLGTVFPELNYF